MMNAYVQMAGALIGVVGVILAAGFFLRKKQGTTGIMKVLGYQPLGQKAGIAAVKVGTEVLLVGVTGSELTLLKTFPDGIVPEGKKEQQTAQEISDTVKKLRTIKDTMYAAQ